MIEKSNIHAKVRESVRNFIWNIEFPFHIFKDFNPKPLFIRFKNQNLFDIYSLSGMGTSVNYITIYFNKILEARTN